jgi:tRNA nucleotidyltransferase (CCA-adding enzyme)
MLPRSGIRPSFRSITTLKSQIRSMSGSIHLKPVVSSRVLPPEPMEIKLTEVENQVCMLLDECTRQLKDEKGLATSCRVAGGWVRDKVN